MGQTFTRYQEDPISREEFDRRRAELKTELIDAKLPTGHAKSIDWPARAARVRYLRDTGHSYREIAEIMGLSQQRIVQIAHQIDARDSASAKTGAIKPEAIQQIRGSRGTPAAHD